MDPSIIAAIISAISSVMVAVIGKHAQKRSGKSSKTPKKYAVPSRNKNVWIGAVSILVLWILLSPPLIHWDLGGFNFFILAIVTLLLSGIWPIKPSSAAATVLILYPVNYLMEPFAKSLRGMDVSTHGNPVAIGALLGFAFLNALGSWALARWRGKELIQGSDASAGPETVSTEPTSKADSLAEEISKLGKLHESGLLSEEEFQRAKKKLLEGS